MDSDLKWIIGIAAGMAMSFIGILVAAFRNLANRISASSKLVHGRIDDVKDKYVRRDDLDGHIQRLEGNVRELREEMRDNHRQVLDALKDRPR